MKLETMSSNIVNVLDNLSRNEMLGRLLYYNTNPYDLSKPAPTKAQLLNGENAKLSPLPFNTEATINDGIFIRVYYNSGDFNENEVIAESQLHIDVICATDLWLMEDTIRKVKIVRPYEVAGRVMDLVGKRSVGTHIKLKFTGYQHLYINTKFHCIRLYAEYMSVEK